MMPHDRHVISLAAFNEVSEALGDVVFVTSQLGAQLNCEKGFVVLVAVNEGSP